MALAKALQPVELVPVTQAVMANKESSLNAARRHLRRAFLWDLQRVEVSERERSQLVAAGVHDETLQRFAVWRRSSLLLVVVPTLLAAGLSTIDTVAGGQEGLSRVGRSLLLAGALVVWAMPLSALLAAWWWKSLKRSQRVLTAGWFAAFLPPFLLALVPVSWWFAEKVPAEEVGRRLEYAVKDAVDGLRVAFTLLPAALSVLPGLVRACVKVKTLLPAAILPGWFLMTGPPFYLLLWLVALIALNQVVVSPLLVAGILLVFGAPMVYLARADLFVRPLPARASAAIDRVRRVASLTGLAGGVLLVVYLLTATVAGRWHLLGLYPDRSLVWLWQGRDEEENLREALEQATAVYWVGDLGLVRLYVQFVARSLFMTTVFAGMLVGMSLSLWRQEKRFVATPESSEYDEAMAALGRVLGKE
jgi:hypothetical protein